MNKHVEWDIREVRQDGDGQLVTVTSKVRIVGGDVYYYLARVTIAWITEIDSSYAVDLLCLRVLALEARLEEQASSCRCKAVEP